MCICHFFCVIFQAQCNRIFEYVCCQAIISNLLNSKNSNNSVVALLLMLILLAPFLPQMKSDYASCIMIMHHLQANKQTVVLRCVIEHVLVIPLCAMHFPTHLPTKNLYTTKLHCTSLLFQLLIHALSWIYCKHTQYS